MNKICLYFLSLVLFSVIFSSCNNKPISTEKIITVTIEPQRYFAERLVDSLFTINTMVPPGSSPESYDPTPQQMILLSKSKAYFQVGYLGFENVWIDKLKENNKDLLFFNNGKDIHYITSENHIHSDNNNHYDCSHTGADPHTWSSPKEALIIIKNMYEALIELDPENSPHYLSNYQKLKREIVAIDQTVTDYLAKSSQKGFIIYHPALSYFAQDYGLTQYTIENDGKEPTPEQIKNIIEIAKEKNINTIFIQEEFDKKNANTIAKETGSKLIVINPLSYSWEEEILHITKALSDE